MADVFISYARQDASLADGRGLEKIFKTADPPFSWWRDNSIAPGSSWNHEIRDQLQQCRCVVVIWSPSAWASPWVRQEAFYGYVQDILVPIWSGDVVLEPPFNMVQCVDGKRSLREPLLAAIRKKLDR